MREREERRLTDVKEGDLVLCVAKKHFSWTYLMVVDRVGFTMDGIAYFSPKMPAYRLISSNDATEVSGFEVRREKRAVYEDRLAECFIGKKNIVDYLRGGNLKHHVDWIEKLPEDVSSLPKSKRLEYIPLD